MKNINKVVQQLKKVYQDQEWVAEKQEKMNGILRKCLKDNGLDVRHQYAGSRSGILSFIKITGVEYQFSVQEKTGSGKIQQDQTLHMSVNLKGVWYWNFPLDEDLFASLRRGVK
jgi:hypothetical protein